ncbi:hypothetical protein NBRC110019_23090 [Neptunitalea chrysea]|uniref:Uncharacterized protein n=1 Tax=Neptunitalea chrysea TaxID=1647581 RepID=A0A9W6EV17_9FLAO|nr:hypothetical protein [Neptunitalea chrysea]GLB53269.1 hypothetical protein NBRC110019_23090 [Neptunitalea chrysea]
MCCALTVFAQSNELTSEEFYNIQFNGVSFKTLEATKGSTEYDQASNLITNIEYYVWS